MNEKSGYDSLFTVPAGENLLKFEKDGSFTVTHPAPEERSNVWKGAQRIAALSDDAISLIRTRPSGIVDYIVDGVSVSWRGLGNGKKREYLCLGHRVSECPHTRRLNQWREDRA